MRFLKNKINQVHQLSLERQNKLIISNVKEEAIDNFSTSPSHTSPTFEDCQPKRRRRVQGTYFTSERARSTKNVVKNYGKAICSFSISDLALPYLGPMLEKENVSHAGFVNFVANNKDGIESIQSFRTVLLLDSDDSPESQSYKRIFAQIAEVFIKYFSVNWIFSGRITHKEAHLKFRFRMMRRIKDPENFFYIQKPSRGRKSSL